MTYNIQIILTFTLLKSLKIYFQKDVYNIEDNFTYYKAFCFFKYVLSIKVQKACFQQSFDQVDYLITYKIYSCIKDYTVGFLGLKQKRHLHWQETTEQSCKYSLHVVINMPYN